MKRETLIIYNKYDYFEDLINIESDELFKFKDYERDSDEFNIEFYRFLDVFPYIRFYKNLIKNNRIVLTTRCNIRSFLAR